MLIIIIIFTSISYQKIYSWQRKTTIIVIFNLVNYIFFIYRTVNIIIINNIAIIIIKMKLLIILSCSLITNTKKYFSLSVRI